MKSGKLVITGIKKKTLFLVLYGLIAIQCLCLIYEIVIRAYMDGRSEYFEDKHDR